MHRRRRLALAARSAALLERVRARGRADQGRLPGAQRRASRPRPTRRSSWRQRRVRRLPRPRRRAAPRRAAAGRPGARRRPRARRRLLRLRQARPRTGARADPFFKPDWSPTYALGAMYIGHLLVVRRSLAEEVGGFDSAFDTIQDFEFMLRVSERTERIHHIPRILYHWRAIPGSIAAGADQKDGRPGAAGASGQRAPRSDRRRRAARSPHPRSRTGPSSPRIRGARRRRRSSPSRSAWSSPGAAATRLGRLLASLLERRRAPPGEVIVVGADAAEIRARRGRRIRCASLADDGAVLSRAAGAEPRRRGGERPWLLFCSRRRRGRRAGLARRSCGCTPRCPASSPLGRCSRAPTGARRRPGSRSASTTRSMPMLAGLDADGDGYYGSLVCARDVSALSDEFMLSRRAAFERAGGFEENFLTGYEDFDLCQRLRAEGGGRLVYAARPAGRRARDPGGPAGGARHRRPGPVRRSLVRPARRRRPVLQPQLRPRARRASPPDERAPRRRRIRCGS